MLSFKNNDKPNECPIDQNTRLWMENAFLWLLREFNDEKPASNEILIPESSKFSYKFDGSFPSLIRSGEIVARQMGIDINSINLSIYDGSTKMLETGIGHRTRTQFESNQELAFGIYSDKSQTNHFEIYVEKSTLLEPISLIAILAHEFSHVKILGENHLEINDESLTDLMTVVFGMGIFNANASFQSYKNFEGWGNRTLGYLNQKEWGYALALYAYYRNEISPFWIKYLSMNIKSDYLKSEKYIFANKEKIFKEKFMPPETTSNL